MRGSAEEVWSAGLAFIDVFDEGFAKVGDGDDEGVFDGGGGDGVFEAEFFGFGDALVGAENRANFPAEADLAKDDVIFGEFAAGDGGGDSETDGEIGGGILEFHAADHVDEDIFVA